MVQKFFLTLFCLLALQGQCFAIQFYQPQEIGWFGIAQAGHGGGGFVCKNASSVNGDYFTKYYQDNRSSYGRGMARFGTGKDSLYVHYDAYRDDNNKTLVGGESQSNAFPVMYLTQNIYKIASNDNIVLYPLVFYYGPERDYTIIGTNRSGSFVKYIDTADITRRYFGNSNQSVSPIAYTDLKVTNDTLVIYYGSTRTPNNTLGEFRFKWDNAAQWFGIEQIVY